MDKLMQLLERYREIKHELTIIENELVGHVESFRGSLPDAIGLGLVRPTVPLPQGYVRHLRERTSKQRKASA